VYVCVNFVATSEHYYRKWYRYRNRYINYRYKIQIQTPDTDKDAWSNKRNYTFWNWTALTALT